LAPQVHEYLRSKLCSLYENDCIFDKFECCWNGNDTAIMTGSYNNFFRMFDRNTRKEVTYEASREIAKPKTILKPRKVLKCGNGSTTIRLLQFINCNLSTADLT
jgi:serine/threonine-protein phosphatase 2A regulatory subunit B